ncbi:MAG: ABC transporter substrate-binding protein [Candidatus Bipolaricaulia bacterium]
MDYSFRRKAVTGVVLAVLLIGLTFGGYAQEQEQIYQVGIYEDPTTTNIWNMLGEGATVWNFAIMVIHYPSLFSLSDQRFDFIPSLAADFPTDFTREGDLFTSEVTLKPGITWSDGTELTTDDVKFTYDTIQTFGPNELGGNWASYIQPPELLDRIEVVDQHTVKFFLTEAPGLAQWQFGMLGTPILQKAYWESKVDQALAAEDPVQTLIALEASDEPRLGGFLFNKWERGAFVENLPNPDYFFAGSIDTLYENGTYTSEKPGVYKFTAYGTPRGPVQLEVEAGPFVDSTIYSIYSNQAAAVLALQRGDIDFIINPLGLQRGFLSQLQGAAGVTIVENPANGFRYLSFNVRREPFNIVQFRQAIATLIDREFVSESVLQNVALPLGTVVPPGNVFWFNPDVNVWGQGMSRAERVAQAVDLLKSAGFSWIREPKVDLENDTFEPGNGLFLPNGELMNDVEMLAPGPGYDPMRSTFALWIERWIRDVGIPVRANLKDFNYIVTKVFNEQDFDMQILGWGLSIYPDYLHTFWHSSQAELGGFNMGGYANPDFDALADEFLRETDINRAREQAFQLQQFLADDVPYIVLFTSPLPEAFRADRVTFPYTDVLDGIQGLYGMTTVVRIK